MYYTRMLASIVIILCFGTVFAPVQATAYDVNKNVEVSDPLESVNRSIYSFNKFLDKIILKPVAKTYRVIVPKIGRKAIRNILSNLTEPVTFLNSVLQGSADHTFTTFWRFTINSTVGIGGIFDVASDAGLEHRSEDFGQTIGVYGVGNGPYLMLPLFGPSNTRDLVGRVVDGFSDPYNYLVDTDGVIGRGVISAIDKREELIELVSEVDRTSLDTYATIRSLYTQRRLDEIKNGK